MWFWPISVGEFLTFLVLLTLVFILFILFHYNYVQVTVREKSRCVRDKNAGRKGGIYSVYASNTNNDRLFNVAYDLTNKSFEIKCACKEGNIPNTFKDIRVYNLATDTQQKIPQKMCACDQALLSKEDNEIYYSGFPGLVSFMNTGDTTFFEASSGSYKS